MSSLNNNFYIAIAALGGIALYRWCTTANSPDRLTAMVSRVLAASAGALSTNICLSVVTALQQRLISFMGDLHRQCAAPEPLMIKDADDKRAQEVQLAVRSVEFFNRPLETILPKEFVVFFDASAERFNLLNGREIWKIILQNGYAPKRAEADKLVGQLFSKDRIKDSIHAKVLPIQQSIQKRICRARVLRGVFGNDGEIHAAYVRGDEAEKDRLYFEYAAIGGGRFNPDIDVDRESGRYSVDSGSQIDRLQKTEDSLRESVVVDCIAKHNFWCMLNKTMSIV